MLIIYSVELISLGSLKYRLKIRAPKMEALSSL